MRKAINSDEVIKPSGTFSQVLRVGDYVFVSGQMGIDFKSGMQADLEGQMKALFDNTHKLFKEMNMNLNQIVTATVFVTKDVDLERFDELYEEHFKFPYPARTLAIVERLPEADAMVEISFAAIDLSAYQIMNECDDEGCNCCENDDCEHH